MSDEPKPSSWPGRFFSGCLKIFGGVLLLVLAIEAVERIWPALVIAAVVVGGIWLLVRWLRRRRQW